MSILGLFGKRRPEPTPPVAGPARFEGLLNSNVTVFTVADRRNLTAILEDFEVQWTAADNAGAAAEKSGSRYLGMAVSPAAQGKAVRLTIAGTHYGAAAPPARVTARIGGHSFDVPVTGGDGDPINFSTEVPLAVDADAFPLTVEAVVPRQDDPLAEPKVAIESIELTLRA